MRGLMKLEMIKIPLLCLCCILLFSCEGGTTFENTVTNHTTEKLIVVTYTNQVADSTEVPPGSARLIYWEDQMGSFVSDTVIYNCLSVFDSLRVLYEHGEDIKLNVVDQSAWEHDAKRGVRNSFERCNLDINTNDV